MSGPGSTRSSPARPSVGSSTTSSMWTSPWPWRQVPSRRPTHGAGTVGASHCVGSVRSVSWCAGPRPGSCQPTRRSPARTSLTVGFSSISRSAGSWVGCGTGPRLHPRHRTGAPCSLAWERSATRSWISPQRCRRPPKRRTARFCVRCGFAPGAKHSCCPPCSNWVPGRHSPAPSCDTCRRRHFIAPRCDSPTELTCTMRSPGPESPGRSSGAGTDRYGPNPKYGWMASTADAFGATPHRWRHSMTGEWTTGTPLTPVTRA